ncbi:hypothetical protein ACFLZM_04255, partial [Thermodesulfobacteriota bacterium]
RPEPYGTPFNEPPHVIGMAYEAFERERMMWGSDFPPCARGGLHQYVTLSKGQNTLFQRRRQGVDLWKNSTLGLEGILALVT